MRKAKKLSGAERLEISILLGKKHTLRAIARVLGRSPNTIATDIRKNKTRKGYDPKRAHQKARVRLRFRRLQWRKIEANKDLKKYVVDKLKEQWNPDEIAGRRKGGHGATATFSERKSRLVIARKIPSLSASVHAEEVRRVVDAVLVKSFSLDNGIENKNHAAYGVPTFFCEPYHSWEKGGVENANKMIRRYFPKGTNWKDVSQKKLDRVVSIINGKPRKILGYRTALEVARKAGIIRDIKNASVLFQG